VREDIQKRIGNRGHRHKRKVHERTETTEEALSYGNSQWWKLWQMIHRDMDVVMVMYRGSEEILNEEKHVYMKAFTEFSPTPYQ
jgi:hypothetical protein